jgi:hypothetical protein
MVFKTEAAVCSWMLGMSNAPSNNTNTNIHSGTNSGSAVGRAASGRSPVRLVMIVALIMGLLASLVGTADATRIKAVAPDEDQATPFPDDGIIFGRAPTDGEFYTRQQLDGATRNDRRIEAEILAEFDVGSGMVRFLDEGDSVSTVIVGDKSTYRQIVDATTVGELFEAVAPPRTTMPAPVAEHRDAAVDILAGLGVSRGQVFENELIHEDDDWADECDDEEFDAWKSGFEGWAKLAVPGSFEFRQHRHFETEAAEVGNLHGYFGTVDEIWFGLCVVNGLFAIVDMERRGYDVVYGGEDGWVGNWVKIGGTDAMVHPGERYLYHNHTHYGPLRRVTIDSFGTAEYSGWEYFISGAGSDRFAPDDQITSNS